MPILSAFALGKITYEAHQQLVQEGKGITVEVLKIRLTGKKETSRSLIDIFKEHKLMLFKAFSESH